MLLLLQQTWHSDLAHAGNIFEIHFSECPKGFVSNFVYCFHTVKSAIFKIFFYHGNFRKSGSQLNLTSMWVAKIDMFRRWPKMAEQIESNARACCHGAAANLGIPTFSVGIELQELIDIPTSISFLSVNPL